MLPMCHAINACVLVLDRKESQGTVYGIIKGKGSSTSGTINSTLATEFDRRTSHSSLRRTVNSGRAQNWTDRQEVWGVSVVGLVSCSVLLAASKKGGRKHKKTLRFRSHFTPNIY